MPSFSKLLLPAILATLLFSSDAQAQAREGGDRLEMRSPTQGEASVPTRGSNMERVRSRFGSPRDTHGPVGDPPITRWDYNGFSVYFEHNLVLHSVRHHRNRGGEQR